MSLTKPKQIAQDKLNLQLDTADLLNSVTKTATPQYQQAMQNAFPEEMDAQGNVTRAAGMLRSSNIADVQLVGTMWVNNPELMNEAINTIINRIGRVYIISRSYMNPWGELKKGIMEYGDKIESIYVGIAKAIVYDVADAEETVFKRYASETYSVLNYLNSQVDYPVTIEEETLRQAFLTYGGLSDLITGLIQSAYNAAAYDEFIAMKYLLQHAYIKGVIAKKTIPDPTTKENIEVFLSDIKSDSNSWLFYSKNYNSYNALTFTPKEDQIFISDVVANAVADVNVFAQTFNVDYARYMGIQKMVDTFGENDNDRLAVIFAKDKNYYELTQADYAALAQVRAMLIDRNFLMVVDNLFRLNSIYNPKGLYYNNFLHKWTIYGIVPFAQAVAYTTESTTVTGVTITPATQNIALGSNAQFTAAVAGTGNPSQLVQWEISGTEEFTKITDNGLVTVASGETVGNEFTVKATSLQDPEKSGTAKITVVS